MLIKVIHGCLETLESFFLFFSLIAKIEKKKNAWHIHNMPDILGLLRNRHFKLPYHNLYKSRNRHNSLLYYHFNKKKIQIALIIHLAPTGSTVQNLKNYKCWAVAPVLPFSKSVW